MAEKSTFLVNSIVICSKWKFGVNLSCRYMPEQNGVAKRQNRSVVEALREILEEKSLPKFYWAEAVWTAVYIQYRIGEKVSVYELYFRRKPNL